MPNKIEMTKEQQDLFRELKKLSKRANQRIVRLERAFGKDTWATRDLKNRLAIEPLQAWTISGRVKVNKSMTIDQLEKTIKATEDFLKKPTSTKRGIKKARAKGIQTLRERYGKTAKGIEDDEAEALYNLFEDNEVNGITNFIPGSTVVGIIEEAREQKHSKQDFISLMETVKKYNGKGNFTSLVNKIYTKYVFAGENEQDFFDETIDEMIENAKSIDELEEIENIIASQYFDGTISPEMFNDLMSKLEIKKNDLL